MGVNDFIQIGSRIRTERVKQGYTQKELARLAGIPYSTYSNYENNNREPSAEALCKIASALNVSVDSLWLSLSAAEEVTEGDAYDLITLAGYNLERLKSGYYSIHNHDFSEEIIVTVDELKELTKQAADFVSYLLKRWIDRQKPEDSHQ